MLGIQNFLRRPKYHHFWTTQKEADHVGNAYRAEQTRKADGTYFEQIVMALLRDRLPEGCVGILPALRQFVEHNENWFHMIVEVGRMGLTDPNRDRGENFS